MQNPDSGAVVDRGVLVVALLPACLSELLNRERVARAPTVGNRLTPDRGCVAIR